MATPRPYETSTFGEGVENLEIDPSMQPTYGGAFGWNGNSIMTNMPGLTASARSMGATAPRPAYDPLRVAEVAATMPRPTFGTTATDSPAMQAFRASQQARFGVQKTPYQIQQEAPMRREAELQAQKDWILQSERAPIEARGAADIATKRVEGEEQRKTNKELYGYKGEIEDKKGEIKARLQAMPNSQERSSYRDNLLADTMQKRAIAAKTGDTKLVLQHDKEIQEIKGSQAMDQLITKNNNDVKAAANEFLRDAKLAQQKGNVSIFETVADIKGNYLVPQAFKDSLTATMDASLAASIGAVADPVAPTAPTPLTAKPTPPAQTPAQTTPTATAKPANSYGIEPDIAEQIIVDTDKDGEPGSADDVVAAETLAKQGWTLENVDTATVGGKPLDSGNRNQIRNALYLLAEIDKARKQKAKTRADEIINGKKQ